jgi:hypothetical protein
MAHKSLTEKAESRPIVPALVLDRNEAATALRISTRKLDYLIGRGAIRPVRIDGRVLVAWVELLRFIESRSEPEVEVAASASQRIAHPVGEQP